MTIALSFVDEKRDWRRAEMRVVIEAEGFLNLTAI